MTILELDSDTSGDEDHSTWKENSTSEFEEEIDATFISILQHRKIKNTISGKEVTEYEYLVEFSPPDKDDNNTKWIHEWEIFDCEKLLDNYWNEKL
jgi:hypothetical protein